MQEYHNCAKSWLQVLWWSAVFIVLSLWSAPYVKIFKIAMFRQRCKQSRNYFCFKVVFQYALLFSSSFGWKREISGQIKIRRALLTLWHETDDECETLWNVILFDTHRDWSAYYAYEKDKREKSENQIKQCSSGKKIVSDLKMLRKQ
jgi:hypothetical protein